MKKVQYFPSNTQGRDFVVGDLHGCLEDLLLALKALNFDEKKDRVFSVGDLIDRGPNSYECAQLVNKDWFFATQGNHEEMMVQSILHRNGGAMSTWLSNGGDWIYKTGTYTAAYPFAQLEKLAKDLNELPYVIVVGEGEQRYNIVHAELLRYQARDSDLPISNKDIDEWTFGEMEENTMLWGRSIVRIPMSVSPHGDLSLTFVGHTPLKRIMRVWQHMYIDTGCVYFHTHRKSSETNTLTLACPTNQTLYTWSPLWKRISETSFDSIVPENNK